MSEQLENVIITGHCGFVFYENSGRKSFHCRDAIAFEKLRFQTVFRPHENESRRFEIPSVLVTDKCGRGIQIFPDVVWSVGRT